MPHSLVLLAAGLGTRFGSVKALAPIGPDGEPLIALSIGQARTVGFDDLTVVVTAQSRHDIAAAVGPDVRLVDQVGIGPERGTPWGTVAALLAALADDGGCVVANGDDLYGATALALAMGLLYRSRRPGPSADAWLVGYRLDRTLSGSGAVSRAVARTDRANRLIELHEHRGVARRSPDVITDERGLDLAPDAVVSMNLWALRPVAIRALRSAFATFVMEHPSDGAECGLPTELAALVESGTLVVEMATTDADWVGVTWPGDVKLARSALRNDGPRK